MKVQTLVDLLRLCPLNAEITFRTTDQEDQVRVHRSDVSEHVAYITIPDDELISL